MISIPIVTPIYNSTLELLHLTKENLGPIVKVAAVGLISFALFSSLGHYDLALTTLKWIGLGFLSSAGLGFGMHTFVLFLAPHIAAVTMAAHTCKSLSFPQPPYPREIICPSTLLQDEKITFFNILTKVGLESFMWGLGTAIGELPPYLVARLKYRPREEKQRIGAGDSNDKSKLSRTNPESEQFAGWELVMIKIIKKVGFFGILLCAAVPNPLFDAAGIASGIAQVPFLTFFGATFTGKAIIKVMIQTSFVILLFHGNNFEQLITTIDTKLGQYSSSYRDLNLHEPIVRFVRDKRSEVLRKQSDNPPSASVLSTMFNWLIFGLMVLFLWSVVRELDNRYRQRTAIKQRRTE